jgi:glycosyltransferase involved in cell wall biosynthesis
MHEDGDHCEVSVLIPSFNSGLYLRQAITSALAQQAVSIEVIVQDGGSTDNTLDVLTAIDDARLTWMSEPDDGQSDALNRALRRANGEFVIWLNADDVLAPDAAAVLLAAARHRGAEVVHGNYRIIDERGDVIKSYTSAPLEQARLLCHGVYVFSGALLIQRQLLLRIGAFDSDLHYAMDYDLLLRLARAAPQADNIPEIVAGFRRQPSAKSEAVWIPFVREHLQVSRRHGATTSRRIRYVVFVVTYIALRPLWRSRLWLRIRPAKHLGGS